MLTQSYWNAKLRSDSECAGSGAFDPRHSLHYNLPDGGAHAAVDIPKRRYWKNWPGEHKPCGASAGPKIWRHHCGIRPTSCGRYEATRRKTARNRAFTS